jgi:tRNA-specific 2-thiouridylase
VIIDLTSNKEIGKHAGLWTYTIGENVRIGGMPIKMFVAKKDTRKNIIYTVPGSYVLFQSFLGEI